MLDGTPTFGGGWYGHSNNVDRREVPESLGSLQELRRPFLGIAPEHKPGTPARTAPLAQQQEGRVLGGIASDVLSPGKHASGLACSHTGATTTRISQLTCKAYGAGA